MGLLRPNLLNVQKGRPSMRDERGFTLIETILALSILVVMIGLVLSSVRLGQNAWQKGEATIEDAETRRFVIKRLSTDVASMYPYRKINNGHESYIFTGQENEFAFVTSHHSSATGLPWGGAMLVNYRIGRKGLRIEEKTVPLAEEGENQAKRIFELGPAIKSLRFSYLGDNGWLDKWDMAVFKELPSAVRVEFIFMEHIRPLSITMPVGVTYDPAAQPNARPQGA